MTFQRPLKKDILIGLKGKRAIPDGMDLLVDIRGVNGQMVNCIANCIG